MCIHVGVIDDQGLVQFAIREILSEAAAFNFLGGFADVGTCWNLVRKSMYCCGHTVTHAICSRPLLD